MKAAEEKIIDEDELKVTIARLAHEIVEKNDNLKDIVLIGIKTRGVPLARRLARKIKSVSDAKVPVGALDASSHRDDIKEREMVDEESQLKITVDGKRVILVDDVMCTGRTTRAAMDALVHYGRPASIQLAVLVDRGHRELPIHADYVGREVPTASKEVVRVKLREVDEVDEAVITRG
jgi:pyrimidine operon attenuation protein/uracil phosphoribosyltransferase